jgi:excisionase family DNA binding protein
MATACEDSSTGSKSSRTGTPSNAAAPSKLSLEEADRLTREHAAITVPQAGDCLGLSRGAAYRAVGAGEIASYSTGRSVRVPSRAIRRLLLLDDASPEGNTHDA